MNLRLFYLIFVFLWGAPTLSAHVDKQLLREYKAAKKVYEAQDYAGAMAAFEPLMIGEEESDITPYAFFYYALAAYHSGDSRVAKDIFSTIFALFPDWEETEEVWYWLGQLRLEEGAYKEGLACLAHIKNKGRTRSVKKLKTHFLRQVDHTATLQALLRLYPEDRVIAQALFDQLARQPLIRRDFELLEVLARDFNLVLKEHDLLRGMTSLKKECYNVAVFLPFLVDEVDYESESSALFVINLYQGIKAAVAALADEGITINLFAYDTKKDPATTAALLKQPEVKHMDLIIGPLVAATTPLVTEFARAHKINLFNPVSENADVVGNNPFAFLSRPSLATQARKAAEFTLQNAGKEVRVGIVYGTSKADFMQAHLYKQYIERSMGHEVELMLPIAPEEAPGFLHQLRERLEADDELVWDEGGEGLNEEIERVEDVLAELTHIYVASTNELIAANMLIAVEMLKLSPCIIGHEKWLEKSSITLSQLQRLGVFLVAPDFIDYEKEGVYAFRKHFYDQFAQYPDAFAYKGYDMMCFLGHMLSQYGVYFQKHWQAVSYPSTIFKNITYGLHHDNQQVPIVRLQKNAFVICNQEASE